MTCTCGMKNIKDKRYTYSYWDLLMLKRPNRLDDFISTVKQPEDAERLLQNGLPRWKISALDSKIPMIAAPKGKVYYASNKVGRKLWRTTAKQDFNLYDLAGNDINFQYNPLYDEHLRPFFSRKVNRNYLMEKGYINKKGEVNCSLKELNDYRRYLKKVYVDEINRKRKLADEIEKDKQLLTTAHKYALQFQDHEVKRTHLIEKSKEIREQIAKEKEMKVQKAEMKKKRREQFAKLVAKWKEEDLRRRILQSRLRSERIRSRIANAQEIEIQRKCFIIRRWNEQEIQRQQRLRQECINKIKKREAEIYSNWKKKTEFQIKKIKTNEQILTDYKFNTDVNISLRNKLVQEEKARMEELFYSIRLKDKKPGLSRKKRRAIKEAILKLLSSQKTNIESSKNIDEAVAEALKTGVKDVYFIVKGAKMKLEKSVAAPDAVNYVLDCIIENSIEQYVNKNVKRILEDVYTKAREQALKGTSTKSITNVSKKFSLDVSIRTQSKLNIGASSADARSLTRGVSFGAVHTIDEVATCPELRSTKERPPTPVPSFTELVSIAFSDPITAPDYEEYGADTGRSTLKKMLHELSKYILKSVLKRIADSPDNKRRMSMYSVTALNLEDIIPKLTKALLTRNITNFSECDEVQQAIDGMFRNYSVPFLKVATI